jgi:hypothetical protein
MKRRSSATSSFQSHEAEFQSMKTGGLPAARFVSRVVRDQSRSVRMIFAIVDNCMFDVPS